MVVRIHFDRGTLVVTDASGAEATVARSLVWDDRTRAYRGRGAAYRELMLALHRVGIEYVDTARAFEEIELVPKGSFEPYPHQRAAFESWWQTGGTGVVELPTGAGKTMVAMLALEKVRRPALIVVPTIDLMMQWQKRLEEHFGIAIGLLGGGVKEQRPLTVTTYDSAAMQIEFHGAEFGFLICDECHHLPSPAYRFIAEASIAPFRLGLTATPDDRLAPDLLGPIVHRVGIEELAGRFLAPYEVRTVRVAFDPDEEGAYQRARTEYVAFLRKHRIDLGRPEAWGVFVMRSQQSAEGRSAYAAYRLQRKLALTSRAKLEELWTILVRHREDRTIVFTEDNETVHELARRLLAPAITHQTKPKERRWILESFAAGDLRIVLTSRVLNEGVDVPDASVGVVLSGSGSVREHVQRLGRILRQRPNKRALLYEILTDVAAESGISERRRRHRAYGGT